MAIDTSIEWTDATWNPVRGCVKVSPGCANCYAETFAERFRGVSGHPYEQGFDLRLAPSKLADPLGWKKPRRIFVNSMSDLFQDGVPDDYIDKVFAVMALAPQHTFQVLTKRAERMRDYVQQLEKRLGELWDLTNQPTWITLPAGRSFPRYPENWPLPNCWLGVSVESQTWASRLVPLMHTPAAVRFVSVEPMLGPVDLEHVEYEEEDVRCVWNVLNGDHEVLDSMSVDCVTTAEDGNPKLDWVIVGGESGPGARPFDVAWARSIVAQCRAAGVACFVKQLGARVYGPDVHSAILDDRKGGDPSEWPEDLRRREYPERTK